MRYMMFIKHTEDYRNKKVPAGLYEAGEPVGTSEPAVPKQQDPVAFEHVFD